MKRNTNNRRKQQRPRGKPTQREIRERCRKIQEEWSEATRRHRSAHRVRRWTVPETRSMVSSVSARLIEGRL